MAVRLPQDALVTTRARAVWLGQRLPCTGRVQSSYRMVPRTAPSATFLLRISRDSPLRNSRRHGGVGTARSSPEETQTPPAQGCALAQRDKPRMVKRPAALPASFYDEAFLYGVHYGDKVQYQTSPAATNLAIRAVIRAQRRAEKPLTCLRCKSAVITQFPRSCTHQLQLLAVMTGVALHHKRKQPTSGDLTALSPASKQLETDDLYDVPVGIATDRGGKLNQEDAYFVGGKVVERLTLNGYSSSASGCFGIFDGHAGDRASRFCAENIFPRILEQLAQESTVNDAITNAVRALDAEFCAIARHASNSAIASAARRNHKRSFATDDGSTLLVAMVRDGLLHVGNVGDSRAVVITRNGDAIAMSDDQKPNRKDERERLEAKGAFVTGKPDFMYKMWPLKKMLDVPRVNGQLAVSRSIGDVSLKSYISCDPEVQTRKISKNDRFLVLATDGLWDVVTNKQAAQLASRFKDPQACADALMELALDRHTTDNVTVLVVKLEAYDFTTSRTDVSSD